MLLQLVLLLETEEQIQEEMLKYGFARVMCLLLPWEETLFDKRHGHLYSISQHRTNDQAFSTSGSFHISTTFCFT